MAGKRFNPEKAELLMSSERKKILPPDEVVGLLNIKPDDTIADLGSGNGYFAIPMAKQTKDTVHAIDVEPKMLDMLKENASDEQVENIQVVESELQQIPLGDQSVSKVMISFVMHEVPNIDKTLREIKRILKTGGTMLVIEWEVVETSSGPPLNIRIPSDKMAQILDGHGFYTEVISLNQENYAVKAFI
ncbi:class I SAM-dependent methyltransferase [Virgibacillus kimchii]